MLIALAAVLLATLLGTTSGQQIEEMETDLKFDEFGFYFYMFQTELTVSESTVSEEYADYQFTFYLDQEFTNFTTNVEHSFYATINFTDFF